MKRFRFAACSALLLSLLSACGDDPEAASNHDHVRDHVRDHDEDAYERLLIADGDAPVLRLVDVESKTTVETYEIAAPARVYRGALGRWGYAVQADGDVVHVIDSGISVQDHGDHAHARRLMPALLSHELTGGAPVHFVTHDAKAAVFFDDDGVALVLDERTLRDDMPYEIVIDTGKPHHGVALAHGGGFLVSIGEMPPDAERATPVGVAAYDESGAPTGQTFDPCPRLHGEASLDDVVAFGCSDGVLIVAGTTELTSRKLAYPSPDGARIGTLVSHPNAPHMVGNFGPEHLCTVDVSEDRITKVEVPAPYLQFAFDAQGAHVLLLDKSGSLHILGAADLSVLASLEVTSAPTDDSDHGDFHPQFAVGRDHAFVTDPARGEVVVVDLEQRAIADRISVEGTPTKIALLGGLP